MKAPMMNASFASLANSEKASVRANAIDTIVVDDFANRSIRVNARGIT